MISTVIISKDRPAQLHLLLESLHKYAGNLFDITVIFEYTKNDFGLGYQQVQEYFYRKNRWSHVFPIRWRQRDGENLSLEIIAAGMSKGDLICLFNDENVLFDRICSYKKIKKLFDYNGISALSLRLGNNTIVQNPYESESFFADIPTSGDFILDKFLLWEASDIEPYTNFGIPFSTGGHIYHKNVLFNVLGRIPIEDHNEFESLIQDKLYSGYFKSRVPTKMSCLEYSAVVQNTIDKISDVEPNDLGVSLETINTRYLKGKRISLDFFNFDVSKPYQNAIAEFK